MATLRVNTTDLPEPQSISVSLQDADYNSGRNQTGYMFRDRVRGGDNAPRKIECKFPPLTPAQARVVLQAVKDASMSLTYPDPYTGMYRTATVYVGDRKSPIYWINDGDILWSELAFNFVEF